MGVLAWARPAAAQSSLTPAEFNALVQELETTTPQPASSAPLFGNFYTITHGESWPPLPADTMGLDFWDLGGGVFLLDDRHFSYNASWAESSSWEPFPTNGGSGGGGGFGPDFKPQVYTTNDLWLHILGATNDVTGLVANLTIHPPWNDTNLTHDLLYTSDLNQPINWRFLMRCVTTNVIARGICDQAGFFELTQTNGDLTVSTNWTALQLAQLLVPAGVSITNATYTGFIEARGTFAGGNGCGLPIDSGVILASGDITNAIGPNNLSGAETRFEDNTGILISDPDLDSLVGGSGTKDAAILEFDVFSATPFTLEFEYIFASEEYPEWIGQFNDPMAIFVSTNRFGTNWINGITNDIALVPGTTNMPVSVNTINGGCYFNVANSNIPPANAQYYVDNHDPEYQPAEGYTNAAPAFNVQYDGMTVLLSAKASISANVTNHVKIAIADYGDDRYDSAVLIGAAQPPCD
jgi:hypothetical protein